MHKTSPLHLGEGENTETRPVGTLTHIYQQFLDQLEDFTNLKVAWDD